MELKGSNTERNLMSAFAGESQAAAKYAYYSSAANKEDLGQIASVFSETAENEKVHAGIWFKYLHSSEDSSTLEHLRAAADGEQFEWTRMYAGFAAEAREEGFNEIAMLFELVGSIENRHEERYRKLVENLEQGIVFKRDEVVMWKCRNCGYIHVAQAAPKLCPVCKHPQSYFELKEENY